jgi:propanediol dehydratase large subunit
VKTLHTVHRKLFDHKLEWSRIDTEKARARPEQLELLREACLVESYLPVYTGKMMGLFWDDLDATTIFTIESMEAYGHYYVLRRYLETVGYKPVSDEEVVELRERERDVVYDDQVRELVNFMGTEHFAAQFFTDMSQLMNEPVLAKVLPEFAAEEVVHSQFAFDLLQARVQTDPKVKDQILEHARNFKHVGAYVRPYVPPAKEDNVRSIRAFNEKFERLLGQPLSDFLVEEVPDAVR